MVAHKDAVDELSAAGNIQTLPARFYHEPDIYDQERAAIFSRSWLLYCHESLLDGQGAYFAATIAGWPVFVIRDRHNELKGFHNVCRHRASQILREGIGKTPVLRCMYHGWVYDTDGNLCKVPGFGGDEAAVCASHKLFPVHVRVWNSLVFISLSEKPEDFGQALGDLPQALAGVDLSGYKFYEGASHHVNCNWKTYVENSMEGYHIPAVHPELNREIDMKTYQVIPGDRIARHVVDTKKDDAINNGLWVWFWPFSWLNVYRNGMNLELIIPTGPETMELRYCYLFRDVAPEAEAENRKTIDMSFSVTQEDLEICLAVQKNLRAGLYDRGELSPRHEQGVAYFQNLIASVLTHNLSIKNNNL